ncbi:unnamed protein product [Rhizophagus irregularis]|nr:unnamed protein product [Rhizophagus irregularis]
MENKSKRELQKMAHVAIKQKHRKVINNEFQSLKEIAGLCIGSKITKEKILQEAINVELKCRVSYLEKSLSSELGDQVSYNYFIENILQKFVTTNEELNGQLKASLRENEELRSKDLLLEKRLQEKEVMAERIIEENEILKNKVFLLESLQDKELRLREREVMNEKLLQECKELKCRVLLLENSLQDKESRFRENETMNEKLKYDVANLIHFNNTNQQRIDYLLSQLKMINQG